MENENNNINLTGFRIRQMRLDNHWTQKDLAQKLGLKNDTAIANYEAGYSTPKDEIKLKMCELFNCSMDYLMGLTSHANPKEELEKELYNFDLTEEEYYEAINCFMNDNIPGLAFVIFYGGLEETKEQKVLKTILHYILDYYPDESKINDLGEQERFEKELEKNLRYGKKMLLSLDKGNIIHNYNIEQDTPEIRAIARDVAKLKPEKKELFKNLLKQMSDEADEASKK